MNDSIYTFDGQDRLAFDFFRNSPTPTGLFLVYAACLFLAIFKHAWSKGHPLMRIAALASYGACVVGVALTYSRGAMCALFGAVAVCGTLIQKHERRWLGATALLTVALLCAVPSGSKRILSSVELQADRSIANRLLLWEGVCRSIVHRFPEAGGKNSLGMEYMKYWQPLEQSHWYSTAVNLWLTIYSSCGIFIFVFVLGGYFAFVCGAWRAAQSTSDTTAITACLILTAFGINNVFSTITDLLILLIAFTAALAPLLIGGLPGRDKATVQNGIKYLSRPFLSALIVSSVPFAVACAKPSEFRIRREMVLHDKNPLALEWFDTAAAHPKGLLFVWLGTAGDEENISAGRLARAACLQGLDAVLAPAIVDGKLMGELHRKKHRLGTGIYYAGIGPGAACALDKTMAAFQKNEEINGLVLACPEGQSPLFSPTGTHNINIPVMFLRENENSNLEYEFLNALRLFPNTVFMEDSITGREGRLLSCLLSSQARHSPVQPANCPPCANH